MQEDDKGLQLASRTQERSLGTETMGALLMDSFRLGWPGWLFIFFSGDIGEKLNDTQGKKLFLAEKDSTMAWGEKRGQKWEL